MHGAGEWRISMGSWEFPTCQDLIGRYICRNIQT